jgi:hypothetical protein
MKEAIENLILLQASKIYSDDQEAALIGSQIVVNLTYALKNLAEIAKIQEDGK